MAAARQLVGCHWCSAPSLVPRCLPAAAQSPSWSLSLPGLQAPNSCTKLVEGGASLRPHSAQWSHQAGGEERHAPVSVPRCIHRNSSIESRLAHYQVRCPQVKCDSQVALRQSNAGSEGPEDTAVPRRQVLTSLGALLGALASLTVAAPSAVAFPGPNDTREAEPQVFFKTPSGTKVQELLEGTGPAAQAGDTVSFHYVCRRSNGYYVYSTVDGDNTPASLPLGQGRVIRGLEEVLAGMRPGGKRRALIPPSAGYVDQTLEPIPPGFGPQRSLYSHAKEPLVFEVLLLKIK